MTGDMTMKKFLCILIFAGSALSAEEDSVGSGLPGTGRNEEKKSNCNTSPYASGCMGLGIGPVISADGKGGGAGATFTYFIMERVGLSANTGAVFFPGQQNYSVGPALTYFVGPFAGYLLTPSLSATRHFIRGDLNAEGWSYGPSIGLLTRLSGPIFWGISLGYYTYQIAGFKASDWSISPVVFASF